MNKSNPQIDREIIFRSQNGDEKAFTELIGKFRISLFSYLVRFCGDRTQAEDLFQETLVKVWNYLPDYRHKNKFAAWLFGIAHNVAIDARRKKKVRELVTYAADLPESESSDQPDAQLLADEIAQIVDAVLQNLPENQRQVFLLRQHGGMSFKEIAVVMKQPLNTVLSHMHYAATKLKKTLREHHVF